VARWPLDHARDVARYRGAILERLDEGAPPLVLRGVVECDDNREKGAVAMDAEAGLNRKRKY